jgi:hypothetical protein
VASKEPEKFHQGEPCLNQQSSPAARELFRQDGPSRSRQFWGGAPELFRRDARFRNLQYSSTAFAFSFFGAGVDSEAESEPPLRRNVEVQNAIFGILKTEIPFREIANDEFHPSE